MSWENIPASLTSCVRESQDGSALACTGCGVGGGGGGLAIIEFIYSVLYEKQFGFQRYNSTEHAILHLTRDITGCFEKGKYTLWVYIDFSKAFDLKCFTIKYFQYSVFLYFKSFCISQYFYPQNKNQICPPKWKLYSRTSMPNLVSTAFYTVEPTLGTKW